QERPKVFQSVRVYAAIDILNRVVDHLMLVFSFQSAIAAKFISEESSSGFYVPLDDRMQGSFNAICDNLSTDAATALQHTHNDNLVVRRLSLSGNAPRFFVLVHIPRLTTNEGFVRFDFARKFRSESFILHRQSNSMKHEPCR